MKKVYRLIKAQDLYGYKKTVSNEEINKVIGNSTHKTFIGGMISMVIKIFFIYYSSSLIVKMTTH